MQVRVQCDDISLDVIECARGSGRISGSSPREGDDVPDLGHERVDRPSQDASDVQRGRRAIGNRAEEYYTERGLVRARRVRTVCLALCLGCALAATDATSGRVIAGCFL